MVFRENDIEFLTIFHKLSYRDQLRFIARVEDFFNENYLKNGVSVIDFEKFRKDFYRKENYSK